MGWSGPPNQINRAVVANYSVPSGNYNPAEMSPYYSNTFPPQPAVPVFDYGGHGMNGYHQMVCPESSGFQYPCVSQPDITSNYLQSQQTAYTHYVDYPNPAMSNSSRQQRNAAEKNRRDKLNSFISEIATLVPMVHNSSKRMDKTSVLRLAATFLRQYQLTSTTRQNVPKLPQSFRSINWFDLVLEEMNGVMITVTSAGKIVFITDNIEKILGHTQSELFGQSLFKITCPEDHVELKKCLAPDDAEEYSAETDLPDCSSDDLSGSESNSSSRLCTSRNSDCKGTKSSSQHSGRGSGNAAGGNGNTNAASTVEKQRRSCYLRLRTRSLARTEQPQYELVQLVGYLEVPKKLTSRTQKRNRKNKVDVPNTNSNEIILVAILKPFKERRVTETSLMEATRDEYITRHLLDGRIIYSDHRISVISGYLFEEVSGLYAFNFMHKEDVRWVLIALRQMLWRGESFGKSCYRLKSKTGEFIYLQTHGYLELNASSDSYASYICVNTLLSSAEGEREIRLMRRRFSALIESKIEPGIVAIARDLHVADEDVSSISETEDPSDLKDAIRAMISNIPVPAGSASEDPENSQFAKAKLMSKALPCVSQAGCANIVTLVEEKSPRTTVMSPQTPTVGTSVSSGSQPSTPTARTPNSPSVSSSCAMQVRPSVLRLASNQPITIYDTSDCDTETTLNSRQQMNSLHCAQGDPATSQMNDRSMYTNHVGVVRRLGESVADDKRVGVVIMKGANKRQFDFEEDCSNMSSVPNKRRAMGGVPPPIANHSFDAKCSQTIKESLSPLQESPLHGNLDFGEDLESCIGACDANFPFEIDSFEQKPNPVQMLDLLRGSTENLKRNHIKLESQMQLQGAQINTLEGEIADVSYTDRFCLENNLGKLREEHTKQAELLKTLRSDHLSLQPR